MYLVISALFFGMVHRRVELQSGKVVFCVFDTVFCICICIGMVGMGLNYR